MNEKRFEKDPMLSAIPADMLEDLVARASLNRPYQTPPHLFSQTSTVSVNRQMSSAEAKFWSNPDYSWINDPAYLIDTTNHQKQHAGPSEITLSDFYQSDQFKEAYFHTQMRPVPQEEEPELIAEIDEEEIRRMQYMLLNMSPDKQQCLDVESEDLVEDAQNDTSEEYTKTNKQTPTKKKPTTRSKKESVEVEKTTPVRPRGRPKGSTSVNKKSVARTPASATKRSAPRERSPYDLRAHIKVTPKARQ